MRRKRCAAAGACNSSIARSKLLNFLSASCPNFFF
jgi:hypothetical protein